MGSAIGSSPSSGRVIAHRGASAYLPEHTLPGYALGFGQGADLVEPDVLLTSDGVPVCLHDLTLDRTTNVADRFPSRARANGRHYAIDFTLAELRTLEVRVPTDPAQDAGLRVPTLVECLRLVSRLAAALDRRLGVVPELKSPLFHQRHGWDLAAIVLGQLRAEGFGEGGHPVLLECFELRALERLRRTLGCGLPLVYLTSKPLGERTWSRVVALGASVGPDRRLLDEGRLSPLWAEARRRGISLYPWTFGDERDEMARHFQELEVAGLFTNNPDIGVAARDR